MTPFRPAISFRIDVDRYGHPVRRPKVWVPGVAAAIAAVGAWLWWQGGGFGGPVSDSSARGYFSRIVDAAMAQDFDELCRFNGSESNCREELRVYCPENFGSGAAPKFLRGDELEATCRESVPKQPPEIVSS